jgi:hypothetical protein
VKVYGAKLRGGPEGGNPRLSGLIAATLLAVVWTLFVYVTHNLVPLAAWGVGGLLGLTVAKRAPTPSPALGTFAALLTAGTVVLTKVLVLVFALRPMVEDEIVRSGVATAAMYMIDMTVHRSFSPDLQAELDRHAGPGQDSVPIAAKMDLSARMIGEAQARAKAATRPERERVVHANIGSVFAREGFLALLGRLFGLMDVVWLALGISSAWKLAQLRPA